MYPTITITITITIMYVVSINQYLFFCWWPCVIKIKTLVLVTLI